MCRAQRCRKSGQGHEKLIWILLAVIGAHVFAAFVHLLVYEGRVMHRMLPGG
jgi:cytochrome b561